MTATSRADAPPIASKWLVVGDATHGEFVAAIEQLHRSASVAHAATVAEACARLEAEAADWIVVAERWPGEFSHRDVKLLQGAAPLARIVGLLGSWCEGEQRTGTPWPGVLRVLWHQWPAQLERELERIARGHCSTWALPATASLDERLLAAAGETKRATGEAIVCIVSEDRSMADWLADYCRQRGQRADWFRPHEISALDDAHAILCDGDDAQRLLPVVAAISQRTTAPIVALVNFARLGDHDRLRAAGATAVLNKPVLVDDLARIA
jgi:CheY-like chemotaxis protein